MKVLVNNQPHHLPEGCSVQALASSLALPDKGVALAVNNRMVPRTEWEQTPLKENDQVVIIQAACGG